MQHQSLFVFDIETVPDTDCVPNLVDRDVGPDVAERREALEQYHLDATGGKNAFPRQPFHKVVAVSFLSAEIERDGRYENYYLKEIRSGGTADSPEHDLVGGFYQFIDRNRPRLVSYNGRGFDLPVLRHRAMVCGLTAGVFHDTTNSLPETMPAMTSPSSSLTMTPRLNRNVSASSASWPGRWEAVTESRRTFMASPWAPSI